MALLVRDRMRIELMEKIRQHAQRRSQVAFHGARDRLRSVLDPTQVLLRHANARTELGEREIVQESDKAKVTSNEFGHCSATVASAFPSGFFRRSGATEGWPISPACGRTVLPAE